MRIQINARNRAHQFVTQADETILAAGLRSGITLPYECASGTCGTCKARLLGGEIRDAWPEAPGRKYLKGADEFLMCQCSALSDAAIEVASFVDDIDPGQCTPDFVQGHIRDSRMLAPDVMSLCVELKAPLDFDAGQFMLLRMAGIDGSRGWSMVNYEPAATTLEFLVKRKPGGVLSQWLFAAAPVGADVELFGPLGRATFYPSIARNILCIAGGSGIAGMMSILVRAAGDDYFVRHDGDVYFGVRSLADAFHLDRLSALRERCGERLRITVVLSEPAADDLAEAGRLWPKLAIDSGFVHEAAARGMKGRLQGVRAYLAGPPPAVDASVRMLLMARVSTDNIRYDKFA